MESASINDVIEDIATKPAVVSLFPVYTIMDEVPVIGVPDAVLFLGSKPRYVIELKTTGGNVRMLPGESIVQANCYAYALDSMGFDCGQMGLAIVRLKRGASSDRNEVLHNVVWGLIEGKTSMVENAIHSRFGLEARIHLLDYRKEKAERDRKRVGE